MNRIDPFVPALCFAFFAVVSVVVFMGVVLVFGALAVFALCGTAGAYYAYRMARASLSKKALPWVCVVVFLGVSSGGWYWYWHVSPLAEARDTCQDLRKMYS